MVDSHEAKEAISHTTWPTQVMKKQRGSAANIWDVVSSLAQALTEARDQLVGLINSKEKGHKGCRKGKENIDTVMRARGGGFSKPYVPNNQQVRSVHRQHARGHVAFGVHSEFKPEPPRNCKQETMAMNWSCGRQAGNNNNNNRVQLYLNPNSNSVQINNNNNNNRGGCESPVSIVFPKSCSPPPREPYDCKRHCIGTQYAALLREEACRARTRRLEKSCDRLHGKPRWARC